MRWVQDFRMKSYASPAKLESIDGKSFTVHLCIISTYQGNKCFLGLGRAPQKRHKTSIIRRSHSDTGFFYVRGSPSNCSCCFLTSWIDIYSYIFLYIKHIYIVCIYNILLYVDTTYIFSHVCIYIHDICCYLNT